MPNLDNKGFDAKDWLFKALQAIVGIFLLAFLNDTRQFMQDQAKINTEQIKILGGMQGQIKENSRDADAYKRRLDKLETNDEIQDKDIIRLKEKHNIQQ